MNPTLHQKKMLDMMAGCSRFTYNRAVAIMLAKSSTQKDAYRIRDRIVTYKPRNAAQPNNFFNDKQWLLSCPKSVRQKAVSSAVANVKACFSNFAAGHIKRFTAPFRTKKREMQNGWCIEMDQKNVVRDNLDLYIFREVLGNMKYRGCKQLMKLMPSVNPDHDPKLQKSEFGEYFLVLSVNSMRKQRNHVKVGIVANEHETSVRLQLKVLNNGNATAAVDPGTRKTLTVYSPENREAMMLGYHQSNDLMKLLLQYDAIVSKLRKPEAGQKQDELKRNKIRIRKRIFYLKKEYRDQVASFLAQRYDVILYPKLNTGDMTKRGCRRLKNKAVRQMLSLGHASIFNRVKEKCAEFGTVFMEVKEHYTSQTCVRCGALNKCDETYHCRSCGFKCDRDVVGAAGIYLKAVRLEAPLSQKVTKPRLVRSRGADP
ncbi:MAG: transposase [Patescibacteria group bacterium]|nr:transposase [Patescibacteria group bacterium]